MSDFPTGPIRGFDPQWAFSEILSCIKRHPPSLIKLDFEPHLRSFLSDPTIASMLSKSEAPANTLAPPHSMEFSEIRNTLSSLSEAISTLQKKTNHPAKSLQTAAATKAPNHSCHHRRMSPVGMHSGCRQGWIRYGEIGRSTSSWRRDLPS